MTQATTSFVLKVYAVLHLKINVLMKQNVKALMAKQGKKPGELARYIFRVNDKKVDSWISHILDENSSREFPLKYWERIAEFLIVSPYQLLIPGIAGSVSERRSGSDRRSWKERREGQGMPARPGDIDLFEIIRALPREDREDLIAEASDRLNKLLRRRLPGAGERAAQHRTVEKTPAAHAPGRGQKRKGAATTT